MTNRQLAAVIMAGGLGTRMKSETPKHLHPLLGRRMPDLDLQTAGGTVRVFALLHRARPVLINLGEPGSIAMIGIIALGALAYAPRRRQVQRAR